MFVEKSPFLPLFNEQGELYGVFLSADLWQELLPKVRPVLEQYLAPKKRVHEEPMLDWEQLKQYWDFHYPVNYEVACEHCGSGTEDWEKDTPRLFRLLVCNLGGYVRFECQHCKSVITKRHFKKHIETTCKPCPEESDSKK